MAEKHRKLAEAGLEHYMRCCGDYPVDLIRYLRNRRWEDEADVESLPEMKQQAEIQQQMDLWNEMRAKYGRAAV